MKKAVIFDLDGVIVSTDDYHYRAWKMVADEEGIYFDRRINERLRGVSRMASLDIMLENSTKNYSKGEKEKLALKKNNYYIESLSNLRPCDVLPGAMELLEGLRKRGVLLAIGSSSKNTPLILSRIGLLDFFDAVSDGNNIKRSKPDPEVFIKAALMLHVCPWDCTVIEDADAGINAAKSCGMRAVGIGSASINKNADYTAKDVSCIAIDELLKE